MHGYIVLSLLTGVRPEEARALRWDRVHLDAEIPYVEVSRSVRIDGDVKTPRSRRTLAIAGYVVQVLREHRERQAVKAARARWQGNGLVFSA